MDREGSQIKELGRFRLDTSARLLWVDGQLAQIPPKELEILCILAERNGDLVTKEELISAVWPNTFVEESNLTRHIYLLRKQLRSLGQEQEVIENIPKRGYRLTTNFFSNEMNSPSSPDTPGVDSTERLRPAEHQPELPSREKKPNRQRSRILVLVAAFAVVLAIGTTMWRYLTAADVTNTTRPVRSIAVLPFATVGDDADAAYLGPGITETLIQKLSRIRQIVVKRAVTAGTPLKATDDVTEVGRRLGVDAIIDGAVQRSGDKVRITARLILVSDGTALWNESFEDQLADLFELQDSLSARVANSLSIELTGNELQALRKRGTSSVEAEQFYQRGRYFWSRRSRDGFLRSIELFNRAIETDPEFAQPHSGIADAYLLLGDYGYLAPRESTAIAKISAMKALSLDESLAEAHTSLAYSLFLYDWSWNDAESSFKRAIELDPNYPTPRQWYAEFLIARGRTAEARKQMEAAQNLDPQSPSVVAVSCWISYIERNFQRALEECGSAIEMDSNLFTGHFWSGQVLEMQGKFDAAIEAYRRALALSPESDEVMASLAHALGKKGEIREAKALLQRLSDKRRSDYVSSYFFSLVYLGLADNESALSSLESALHERSRALPFVSVDPMLDELREDPRFIRLENLVNPRPASR